MPSRNQRSPSPRKQRSLPWLKTLLSRRQCDNGKVAVLGIGSELHGDDAAGVMIVQHLQKSLSRAKCDWLGVFVGGTAPENVTGAIKRFAPGQILLIDAADLRSMAGTIKPIPPEEIGGISCSTHSLPLSVLVSYLTESCHCEAAVVGIQPKNTAFGASLSPPVKDAIRQVVREIMAAVRGLAS